MSSQEDTALKKFVKFEEQLKGMQAKYEEMKSKLFGRQKPESEPAEPVRRPKIKKTPPSPSRQHQSTPRYFPSRWSDEFEVSEEEVSEEEEEKEEKKIPAIKPKYSYSSHYTYNKVNDREHEVQKVMDSKRGYNEVETKKIGDLMVQIERNRNMGDGEKESEKRTYHNLEEKDLKEFEKKWSQGQGGDTKKKIEVQKKKKERPEEKKKRGENKGSLKKKTTKT